MKSICKNIFRNLEFLAKLNHQKVLASRTGIGSGYLSFYTFLCAKQKIVSVEAQIKKKIPNKNKLKLSDKAMEILNQYSNELDISSGTDEPKELTAVLRFIPGEEKYSFTFTFRGKKTLNFNRNVAESPNVLEERIVANLEKKVKKFNGKAKIILENTFTGICKDLTEDDGPMVTILAKLLNETNNNVEILKLKVNEQGDTVNECEWKIIFNPPEIFKIKMLKIPFVGFPYIPLKIEGSPNFKLEKSKLMWEYLDIDKLLDPPKSSSKNKAKGNPSNKSAVPQMWTKCSDSIFYTPGPNIEGSTLKLTCSPSSDGINFGSPFSIESKPIAQPPVSDFLFQERLKRLKPKSELPPDSFRVVTYNVLADFCATPEWFSKSPKESIELDYRLGLLNKEIPSYEPDILCMQEVDEKLFFNNYSIYLAHSSNLLGVYGSKDGLLKEGVATFYNKEKFNLIQSEFHVIKEKMKNLTFWDRIEKNEKLLETINGRKTIFQISTLEYANNPNKILFVANTHLYFYADADNIRLLQTITILNSLEEKISEFKAQNPEKSVSLIFCGDFNCTPPFSSCRLLSEGEIKEDDEDWSSREEEKLEPGINFKHNFNLTSSHPGEELTNYSVNFDGCLDYIYYQASQIRLIESYPPPSKEKISSIIKFELESLPNFYAPSDHLPLISDFCFINK